MAGNSRKNILLLTSDQQHWCTLGVQNPEVQTPNIDRLASKGTLFTRAYTANPTCTPSRASIITGMYPSQHGAYSLGTKLSEDCPTVGDEFAKANYRTALIGKAHFQQFLDHPHYRSIESNPLQQQLDFWRNFSGPFYGFEHVELVRNHVDEHHVGQHYALWMEAQGFTEWRDCFCAPGGNREAQYLTWNLPEEYHYDTWIAERTCALLKQYSENQEHFFLWASFPDPHPPYLVPEPWDHMYDPASITVPHGHPGEHLNNPRHFQLTQQAHPDYSAYEEPDGNYLHGCHAHGSDDLRRQIAVYYGMISMMDKYIGQILDTLDELRQTEETVVLFTTDHGHFYGQHGLTAKGPFHYEDMIKLPFLASCPGTIPQGIKNDALQSLVDLAPTFFDFSGIHIPRQMAGVDQRLVWEGKTECIRDHVLVENRHNPYRMFHKTYVSERYKITVYCHSDEGELFDLQEDPGEFNNRWNDPAAAELKSRLLLAFMRADMAKDPVPMPRVSGA